MLTEVHFSRCVFCESILKWKMRPWRIDYICRRGNFLWQAIHKWNEAKFEHASPDRSQCGGSDSVFHMFLRYPHPDIWQGLRWASDDLDWNSAQCSSLKMVTISCAKTSIFLASGWDVILIDERSYKFALSSMYSPHYYHLRLNCYSLLSSPKYFSSPAP